MEQIVWFVVSPVSKRIICQCMHAPVMRGIARLCVGAGAKAHIHTMTSTFGIACMRNSDKWILFSDTAIDDDKIWTGFHLRVQRTHRETAWLPDSPRLHKPFWLAIRHSWPHSHLSAINSNCAGRYGMRPSSSYEPFHCAWVQLTVWQQVRRYQIDQRIQINIEQWRFCHRTTDKNLRSKSTLHMAEGDYKKKRINNNSNSNESNAMECLCLILSTFSRPPTSATRTWTWTIIQHVCTGAVNSFALCCASMKSSIVLRRPQTREGESERMRTKWKIFCNKPFIGFLQMA